ncbi:MAG TPA: arginine deiminase family protein [Longimicrobium sp.]|nr:arginine deiminase family protein [Longimicrobium sp.]
MTDQPWIALTRDISPALEHCELTHLERAPIDLARAREQHEAYERALAELGCDVRRLPAGDDMPDSVFIEDTAIVVDEVAVITRPGAASRRGETAAVADALAAHRKLVRLDAPARLDGGDVMVVDRALFVGRSERTNMTGIRQLRDALRRYGYTVQAVPVRGCLHLKTAVTSLGDGRLLINRGWVPADAFAGYELIDVDADEPFAANALRVGDRIVYPTDFPRTRERLEAAGMDVVTVPADELAKAEGAVTCCSLVFRA